MNANQIMNMIMRMFMRRVISRGMDMGFDALSKRTGKKSQEHPMPDDMHQGQQAPRAAQVRQAPPQQDGPWDRQQPAPENPGTRQQKQSSQEAAQQIRQAMKVTRRINRF